MKEVKRLHTFNHRTESEIIPVPKPGRNCGITVVMCSAS